MNFRLTAILAAVAAVLGVLLLMWDRHDDRERLRLELARRAFRFDPARVEGMWIETGDVRIECRRQGARWRLVRPIAARADPVTIERLLGALQELPQSDIIVPPRRAANPYGPYGLDEPRARIGLITGAATNTILVGRRTPLGDGIFVRQSDHSGLARVPTTLLELLPSSADALRDRTLLEGSAGAITRLDIRGPSGYVQLAHDAGGDWRMYQPFTARADAAVIAGLIEQLFSCGIVHFVQDAVGDLAPYGLDSTAAVTALLNSDSGAGSQMLSFGDALPNSPHLVYARLQAENSIFAVPSDVRQALLVRPEELRDRRIPTLPPDAIARIRIEEPGAMLELQRDAEGQWQLDAPVRAPASVEAVEALLRMCANTRLVAFEEDGGRGESPTGGDPAKRLTRHIRFEPRDEKLPPVVLRIGEHPERASQICVAIDGDSAVAVAEPRDLLEFPLDPLAYRLRDVLTLQPDEIVSVHITQEGRTLQVERDPVTGAWPEDALWLERLLPVLSPLQADALLPEPPIMDQPVLQIKLALQSRGGLSVTLLVGDELSANGPRVATIRGRDIGFALAPSVVSALTPPPPKETPP